MTRREKIILAATGVVAVMGLVMALNRPAVPPQAPPPGQAANEAAQAAGMLKSIQEAALTPEELAALAAIDRKWRVSAFSDKPLPTHEVTAKPAALPRYTGYVELGSGRLAVIDGLEYQVGDTLEGAGYKVVSIVPDQVVLESLTSGQRVTIQAEGGQDIR